MTIDYNHKVMEGVRCLTQLGSKSDGLKELKRLARYSGGRKYPHTFSIESGKDYWRLYVLLKIDLGKWRAGHRGALPNAIASFGRLHPPPKIGADAEAEPKVKGKAKTKGRLRKGAGLAQNAVTDGSHDVTRLYPAGKRLLKPERNLSMAHAPRDGKEFFRWDWNSHGGCDRWRKCERKHESMSGKNLQWEVAAEMLRRGGHSNRQARVIPGVSMGRRTNYEEETNVRIGNNH